MNLIQANKDFTAVGIFQRLFSFIGCLCSIYHSSVAQIQNTVGVLQAQPLEYTSGYDLLYPNNQADIFLIDQCGRLVHRWQDDPSWRPGNVAYLLENGQLVRAKRYFAAINDPIWFSGGGEMVELVDWSGNVLWQFYQNDSLKRLHHDIQPLPNGHVLLVSWELKTGEEALLQGRDPASLLENRLFPDYILEVSPDSGDSVLWEWHAWDHLIQDFDETKPNYGVIVEHPELIDLNFDTREGIPDWLHINSIDYHPQLDQIMLSVLGFDEIWIIDHSTTSEEAAGHVGGRSGQGGDLLYRWGNPMAYQQGDVSDQMLFGQHDAHWVDDLAGTDPFYGQIAVFDNNYRPEFSAGHLIDASFDTLTQSYLMDQGRWLPISYTLTITHPHPELFKSESVSSIQVLSNGHFLMCAGKIGYTIELDSEGSIVWEYVLPFRSGFPVAQGTQLRLNDNFIFRHKRYYLDYPAFQDKVLEPGDYLEIDPDLTICDLITSVEEEETAGGGIMVTPNPVHQAMQIQSRDILGLISITGLGGNELYRKSVQSSTVAIDVADWNPGLYLIRSGRSLRKVMVIH